PDDPVLARGLARGLALHEQAVAVLPIPVELSLEAFRDQIAIGDARARIVRDVDAAGAGAQPRDRHAEPLARALDEHAARLRGRVAKRDRALAATARAARAALIRGQMRVAHHDLDALDVDIELLRHHLR